MLRRCPDQRNIYRIDILTGKQGSMERETTLKATFKLQCKLLVCMFSFCEDETLVSVIYVIKIQPINKHLINNQV